MMWIAWALSMVACWCVAYAVGVTVERRRTWAQLQRKATADARSAAHTNMVRLARELERNRPDLAKRINAAAGTRPGDLPS